MIQESQSPLLNTSEERCSRRGMILSEEEIHQWQKQDDEKIMRIIQSMMRRVGPDVWVLDESLSVGNGVI